MRIGKFVFCSSFVIALFVVSETTLANDNKDDKNDNDNKKCNSCNNDGNSPCKGLLSILNRPTAANAACVVPYNKVVIETGFQYLNLTGGGTAQNFPEATLRIGLPGDWELVTLIPNYIHQSVVPHSGWTANVVGAKHEVGYSKNYIFTVESLLTLPTGDYNFGSAGFGTAFNGIYEYNLTKSLTFTLMVGVTSETTPREQGGKRYNSFNPDVVLTWQPLDKLQFFGEIYGQTNAGPGLGAGYNTDVGVQYLITSNIEIDTEFGQRIRGRLGGFNNYVGVGMGFMF